MALIHQTADIRPTKLELLEEWVPRQPWGRSAGGGPLERVGAYRFDDPAGEVGIETLLVRRGEGPVLQVPLTYRGAPLVGADDALVGTMEHSVLGPRWIYDGCGDPVYVTAVLTAILTGGHQADEVLETDTGLVPRETTTLVSGSGGPRTAVPAIGSLSAASDAHVSVIDAGPTTVVVRRVLDGEAADGAATLRGRWPGQDTDVVLVTA
ncbi:hypothetical protein [Mumia sp. ZJ430]|uniref:CG0192-related protein n=1 Tax=Mumia sp. ZJ430 TaxID=2708083 RepID=UPI00141E54ED|nr:hypothetical protein [Mumia sp. ZJ430]